MIVHHSTGKILQDLNLISSEQAVGFFLMKSLGHNLNEKNWKKLFSENVYITPCSDLPGHLHSGQSFTNFKFKRVPDYPNNRKDSTVQPHTIDKLYNHHTQFLNYYETL